VFCVCVLLLTDRSAEKQWIEGVDKPDFSAEELSHELGVSRVHLYKKMLTLPTGRPSSLSA
jgi:hypothetical protein